MTSFPISELKPFMNQLFLKDAFDAFWLSEASFTTFCTFRIDGGFYPAYFSDEDPEAQNPAGQPYALWRQVRPFCLELIRGKRTPLEFKIVFRLSASNVEKLLRMSGLSLTPEDIDGLFLNLHYKERHLVCTTGTSLRFFTLDKTLDHVWDDMVDKFLKKLT